MYDKEKGLFDAFVKQQMSRRELIRATGKLGLGAAATGILLNQAQTSAMAADFDWMKFKGSKLKLLLNKHPYADAMIANMQAADVDADLIARAELAREWMTNPTFRQELSDFVWALNN